MFCSKCGFRLPVDAHFCAQCGTPVSEEVALQGSGRPLEDTKPVLVVRPVFVAEVAAFAALPFQLFFTVWAGLFFGGFSTVAIRALKLSVPVWSPFAFFAAVAFFGIPYLSSQYKRKTYSRTEYRFFRTRLEYTGAGFGVEEKTIDYRAMSGVTLQKSAMQQRHRLGTIVLATPLATGMYHHHRRWYRYQASGIVVEDIKNSDEAYRTVKELITAATH